MKEKIPKTTKYPQTTRNNFNKKYSELHKEVITTLLKIYKDTLSKWKDTYLDMYIKFLKMVHI